MKICTCPPSKKHTSEHPLPDLRPDLESLANFGLEKTFNIFKNIQKHISSSGVCQGHSSPKFSPGHWPAASQRHEMRHACHRVPCRGRHPRCQQLQSSMSTPDLSSSRGSSFIEAQASALKLRSVLMCAYMMFARRVAMMQQQRSCLAAATSIHTIYKPTPNGRCQGRRPACSKVRVD
jgi:hypothetical protein